MVARSSPAFENVVRAYSGNLFRYAYWQCRDRFLAEDLVQETFTRAWKAWPTLHSQEAVKSWLYSILRHEIARLYERKRLGIDPDRDLDELRGEGPADPSVAIEMREALQELPLAYREPLLLQVLGGFSCEEIARELSITPAAVMTQVFRARQKLKSMLGGEAAQAQIS